MSCRRSLSKSRRGCYQANSGSSQKSMKLPVVHDTRGKQLLKVCSLGGEKFSKGKSAPLVLTRGKCARCPKPQLFESSQIAPRIAAGHERVCMSHLRKQASFQSASRPSPSRRRKSRLMAIDKRRQPTHHCRPRGTGRLRMRESPFNGRELMLSGDVRSVNWRRNSAEQKRP